jgi:hypothetical protein
VILIQNDGEIFIIREFLLLLCFRSRNKGHQADINVKEHERKLLDKGICNGRLVNWSNDEVEIVNLEEDAGKRSKDCNEDVQTCGLRLLLLHFSEIRILIDLGTTSLMHQSHTKEAPQLEYYN